MTKLALITGANRGIGRSTALHLARDGVDVIATYRSHADEAREVVREIEALGRRAVAVPLDVSRPHGFTLDTTPFGRDDFDFLVNNAGFSRGGTVADISEEDVDALIDVHFKGPLLLTQALLPRLADGGAIVNVSTGLTRFTSPQRAVYGAVKGAVEVLTRYLAVELGPRAITANVIAPGPVATDFSDGLIRDTPEIAAHIASLTPLGRIATADDIGAAIANLLRPGNGWITGQRIEVSGGLHV
ncbi:SDR family oxidoreductase [Solirubrobacter sp. CPCC 204708]|uniref:SDR family oxidoreductase n=1 Tax=Solirubrobacter deserti TaxID=2282478 RepID=A0ABT4RG67_9ACTN|nr:SDR family oxidoreductase [Solirubrobacter deserti]MBE2319736.1 SDR family oxidoreductase [Solirubrobacter deserti]MDA0137524.1 SDR family oxidoreductase [Solirubrobacter deserti]